MAAQTCTHAEGVPAMHLVLFWSFLVFGSLSLRSLPPLQYSWGEMNLTCGAHSGEKWQNIQQQHFFQETLHSESSKEQTKARQKRLFFLNSRSAYELSPELSTASHHNEKAELSACDRNFILFPQYALPIPWGRPWDVVESSRKSPITSIVHKSQRQITWMNKTKHICMEKIVFFVTIN